MSQELYRLRLENSQLKKRIEELEKGVSEDQPTPENKVPPNRTKERREVIQTADKRIEQY